MMCHLLTLAAATLFLLRASSAQNDPLTLELASVVFRHGDRSPVGTFPKDACNDSSCWPQGFGQLSLVGMAQQHQLGEILKERYVTTTFPGFLNENYTRVQVYVRSTDVDRTLMSAEAQLSGLFPPNTDQQFNDNITWQPIPVHTVPTNQDLLLRPYDSDCPMYAKLREADKATKEYQDEEKNNQEFFNMLALNTGLNPVNLSNIWHIQDILFVENATAGKGRPTWLSEDDLVRLGSLADFTMRLMYNSVPKKRITAGHWLQKVLWDMQSKANGTLDQMKLFLYSAHDTTVAAMMSALGVWNGKQPSYATAFFIELYSNPSKEYFVKLFWRKGPINESVVELNATKLEDFEKFVTPLIPTDWNKECDIMTPDQIIAKSASQGIVALGVLFSISVIALIVVSIVLGLVCYEKGPRYQKLSSGAEVSNA